MVVQKIDLLEPFDNVTRLLKILGLWYSPNETIVYKIYKNFVMATCFLYTLTCTVYGFKFMSFETLEIAFGAVEGVLKSLMFRLKFQKIAESWQQIRQQEFQPRNEHQRTVLKWYIEVTKSLFLVYFFGVYIGCISALTVSSWLRHKDFPTDHWFPFNYRRPFLYQYIYVHITVGFYLTAFLNCASDSCFYLSLLHITAQCEILADTLKNVHDLHKLNAAKKNSGQKGEDEVMNQILIECMKHYNLIKKYTSLVADCFKEIITLQFVPTIVMICIAMYKISTLEPSNTQFWFFAFTELGAITQIFIYCFVGNLVTSTSQKLFYATFESQWYNASQKFKKNLITVMMAVQRPVIFYGWNIFAINYATFKSIVQTSWSMCVAFRSTQDL
ncbi:odorant receptor 48 [Tribolium castaneum]|uniref:Odorant receptor n=2 Tax=Tribolium castaneum TaxID=7070 RepID=D6WBE4_TRICA|nr:PREDICTED: odorant receptor 4 [Tribolium castaneum]EEZ99304.2 odorant receptor 48 [Tribolium castaneum]|eukprot:XP_008190319.1 PREDICTED: odorant receptor 4 [Tribolium castaneum]